MPVQTTHPLYEKRKRQWQTVRDCVEGEDAIKSKNETYLPRALGLDQRQYDAYKQRARWVNYTGRTLDGLHGLIFRRDPVIQASDEFKSSGILNDIDRRGTSIYQFLSDMTYDVLQTSFGGVLVDLPKSNGPTSQFEAEKKGIRPYMRYYPAESIINWRYGVVDSSEKLVLVVLQEDSDEAIGDEFSHDSQTQYRVLDINNGTYRQRVIRTFRNKKNEEVFDEESISIVVNNKSVSEIPFIMLPSSAPEKPMLLDLAYCNIGHYQKSADYENGVHLTTLPTGYVTGHKQARDDSGENESIRLGGDQFLIFEEEEAKVGTLVFSGAGLTHSETALKNSLSDMAVLGTRLIVPEKGTSESADSAKIHRAGENAILATFAKNISDKISAALNIMNKWCGFNGEIKLSLCTDYDTLAFDPNALNSLANLADKDRLPMPYIYFNLRNGEYAPSDSDYEEYATLLAMEKAGASPLEVFDYYNKRRMGQNPEPKNEKPKVAV